MADLEKHAIKRDKRFLVRLVLGIGLAVLGGSLLYAKMTSPELGGCAADAFGSAAEDSDGSSH